MNFLQKLIYSRKLFKYFIPQIHNILKLPFVIRHKSRGAETEETMKLALSKKSSSSQRVDYIKDCDYIEIPYKTWNLKWNVKIIM